MNDVARARTGVFRIGVIVGLALSIGLHVSMGFVFARTAVHTALDDEDPQPDVGGAIAWIESAPDEPVPQTSAVEDAPARRRAPRARPPHVLEPDAPVVVAEVPALGFSSTHREISEDRVDTDTIALRRPQNVVAPSPSMGVVLRALEGEASWKVSLRAAGAGAQMPRVSEEALEIAHPLVASVARFWKDAVTQGAPIVGPRRGLTPERLLQGAPAWREDHAEFMQRQGGLRPPAPMRDSAPPVDGGRERDVTVRVDAFMDGRPTRARVVESSGDDALDERARIAVARSLVHALERDGRRVSSVTLRLRALRTGRWSGCGGVQSGRDDRGRALADDAKVVACGVAMRRRRSRPSTRSTRGSSSKVSSSSKGDVVERSGCRSVRRCMRATP